MSSIKAEIVSKTSLYSPHLASTGLVFLKMAAKKKGRKEKERQVGKNMNKFSNDRYIKICMEIFLLI